MAGRRFGAVPRVLNILILRGFGSAASVLLTLVVARVLDPESSARFLFAFNITTIAAVCFRWGLDDVIIRSVASAADRQTSRPIAARLLALGHQRVALWMLSAVLVVTVIVAFSIPIGVKLTTLDLGVCIAISGLVALSALGGRAYQGIGRNNLAAVVLNILVPTLTLIGLVALATSGLAVTSLETLGLYGVAALLAYVSTVWAFPLSRPRWATDPDAVDERRLQNAADRRAANRLGVVVLSQQLLNWSALLIVPVAYGAAVYTSFVVNFKIATLISLAMLAVNFTYSSRIAAHLARGEVEVVRRLTRMMALAVLGASLVAGAALVLSRDWIYGFAEVDPRLDGVLLVLALGQVFFALSAVFSLVLTMGHDEGYLLRVQGIITAAGVVLFIVLSLVTAIEIAVIAFIVSYGSLSIVLWRRVVTFLNHAA